MVVVTLTTVPERLRDSNELGIKRVIQSLCEQNYSNYEVHFNIPHVYNITKEKYTIPSWLDEYVKKYSNLKIFRVDDIGPPTKFVPSLIRLDDSESILIVVDDDLIYHPDMISEHIKFQKEYPDSVICYEGRGFYERLYNDNRDSFSLCVTQVRETQGVLHYKSVSYKKKLFDNDFFSNHLNKTLSDDVLVSKYFLSKKIKMYVVPYEPEIEKFSTLESWEKHMGVETFPVISHANVPYQTGCNHPDMLQIQPRFYDPDIMVIPATEQLPLVQETTEVIVDNINLIQLLKTYDVGSPKFRIGNKHDGGYVINELIAQNTKRLISIGMGYEDTFETEWFSKYPETKIEAYDGTYQCGNLCHKNPEYVNKQIFYTNHNVGYEKQNIPINVILEGKNGILLKVDTEGAEYKIFEHVNFDNIVGLIIEIHHLQEKPYLDEFKKLLTTKFNDLVLCHIHANSWGLLFDLNLSKKHGRGIYIKDFPNTLELTYVHKKYVTSMKLENKSFPDINVDTSNNPDANDIDLYWVNSL